MRFKKLVDSVLSEHVDFYNPNYSDEQKTQMVLERFKNLDTFIKHYRSIRNKIKVLPPKAFIIKEWLMAYIKAIKNLTIHNRNLKESNRDKKIDWVYNNYGWGNPELNPYTGLSKKPEERNKQRFLKGVKKIKSLSKGGNIAVLDKYMDKLGECCEYILRPSNAYILKEIPDDDWDILGAESHIVPYIIMCELVNSSEKEMDNLYKKYYNDYIDLIENLYMEEHDYWTDPKPEMY